MNLFYRLFFVLLLMAGLLSCQHARRLYTPAERSAYAKLTTNAEVIAYLNDCIPLHPSLSMSISWLDDSLGFPVIFFSDSATAPAERLRIMMIAQQHGNEPSGLEGLLLFIGDLASGKHDHWLQNAELLIVPQCNPYGGDKHIRRNAAGIDLNRDHLLLHASETRIIQQLFHDFDPHFTVDFHEYFPFGKTWEEFGYLRNFDIQLGGPTNLNTSDEIRHTFSSRLLPYVESQLRSRGYSFFEYTLGHLPSGERMRRSTTDIDDGRQSFAITGTFSVIVEGMNGRDSLERLERRATSQMLTAEALVSWAVQNRKDIIRMVKDARKVVIELPVPVAIRQEHFPDGQPLLYPLRSLRSGKDTIFVIENYHNKVVSNLDVMPPKGYLVPKHNSLLVSWLDRHPFIVRGGEVPAGTIIAYRISGFEESVDEEVPNQKALVEKANLQSIDHEAYFFLPLNNKYNLRLIHAFEPQSMYGLINYKSFESLKEGAFWPVLRLE